MGVATGCGCKEVTYPYSSCICSFLQQHPHFLNVFFVLYIFQFLHSHIAHLSFCHSLILIPHSQSVPTLVLSVLPSHSHIPILSFPHSHSPIPIFKSPLKSYSLSLIPPFSHSPIPILKSPLKSYSLSLIPPFSHSPIPILKSPLKSFHLTWAHPTQSSPMSGY